MSFPDGYSSTFRADKPDNHLDQHRGTLELGPDPGILEDVRAFVRRFVVLDEYQADTVALWAAHTHAVDAFDCTPYLAVTSAEKRSGKTRLLEVLELLSREPLSTANISDAALFRVIDNKRPTLLIDEVDAIFGKKSPREELRGMLNAGYRRGATTHRMGGANNTTLQTFSVFCPKAFTGIGDCLPDTITDRSIPIRLKRRTRNVAIERFRLRDVPPEGHGLRERLAGWLEPYADHLADSRPDLPDELDDRAQDVWEPLLAIADLAGGDWPQRARTAARALSTGVEREDDSITAVLVRDIATVFEAKGDRLRTVDLLEGLHAVEESPWGVWYGKPLTAHGLSRLLKPYRIKTMPVRTEGNVVKGYKVEQFSDAFAQLGVSGVTGVTPATAEALSQSDVTGVTPVTPTTRNEPSNGRRELPGDDGYLEHLYAAFEAGHVTEGEWYELLDAHRQAGDAAPVRADRKRGGLR